MGEGLYRFGIPDNPTTQQPATVCKYRESNPGFYLGKVSFHQANSTCITHDPLRFIRGFILDVHEQAAGLEPASSAWKAGAQPLYQACIVQKISGEEGVLALCH